MVTVITYGWQWFAYGYLLFMLRFDVEHSWYNVLFTFGMMMILVLYYAITEWRFGKTLGKHLLGLRVVDQDQKIAGDRHWFGRGPSCSYLVCPPFATAS